MAIAFATKRLPGAPTVVALDGSDVRVLLGLSRGTFAHFELAAGATARAVAHHTVEEIWYFVGGQGEMWRKLADQEQIVTVEPGVCITIPVGTSFQFRALGDEPLAAVSVTMPPWPGDGEAHEVQGRWAAAVG